LVIERRIDVSCGLGDHTKITLKTKNIFIEITGTDLKKLEIALDTLVAMFSQYCATKFQ